MTLPSFKASKQSIIVLAVMAGIIFCLGGVVYYVCAQKLGVATADLNGKQKQVDESVQTANRLKVVECNYLETQSELSFLETSVSSKEYVPTMLKQLEALGKSLNLRVVSVRPQAAPPPPPVKKVSEEGGSGASQTPTSSAGAANAAPPAPKAYDELTIDVELEGNYWNARDFVNRLTRFPKIVAVKEMQMMPADVLMRASSPRLVVRLRLTAFVFPTQAPPPGAAPTSQPVAPVKTSAADNRRSRDEG